MTLAQDAQQLDPTSLERVWRDRIAKARAFRAQFEPIWLSNLAFAAGQQWLVWDPNSRRMRHLRDMDDRYADRELYTADRINEYLQAQLGELSGDDDRPELLLAQEGDSAQDLQKELNDCAGYAWDYEWRADQALAQMRRLCLKLGVAAIRIRFDPNKGKPIAHVPLDDNGDPRLDDDSLAHLEQQGTLPDGSLPQFKLLNEGRTLWEPLSAFAFLTPPGVTHEDAFPWEIVWRPVPLDHVQDEYGAAATELREDTDIASTIGLSTSQAPRLVGSNRAGEQGRLRDHVWLGTCYQRPTGRFPKGYVAHFASNQIKFLRLDEELPHCSVDGEYHSGVHYFHWWRRDDQFQSRSLIEALKDPQRIINRRKTQNVEIIDRGMPKAFVKEGALVHNPVGLPLEVVELSDTTLEPHFFAGIGPGGWMYEDIASVVDDLSHASTLSPVALGENPLNVKTYSQLALINENESGKRSLILSEHKRGIARCLEDGMEDIRRYWPEEKPILIAGPEGAISQQVFERSKIPDFFVVRPATGAAKPRSQGAELTKVDAIWAAASASGLVAAQPQRWVEWYGSSLNAGQALDLPGEESGSQVDFAQFENFLMLDGQDVKVSEYDLAPVHVPIHREAQDQARAGGDMDTFNRIQAHVDEHIDETQTTRKAWRYFDPTDTQDLASDLALDEDQALRENQMMIQGQVLNPEAYANAMSSLQRGINPETGQQVGPNDDLQGILERAALAPTYVENFQMHMDRHGKVIKSEEFLQYPPEVRRRFLTHFELTRNMFLSLPTMPEKVAAPKVSLQLRESVGPTTVSDVLRRAGVPEADAQTLAAEPSMENIVSTQIPPPEPTPPPASATPKP
jgi:hypothetical protein